MLDGVGAGLQSVAVPGLVARILNGTGRVNVGQGSVMTVQTFHRELAPDPLPKSIGVRGHRCLFLDIAGPGGGGPDFRLGEAQLAWIERELQASLQNSETSLVFMHAYPADLADSGERERLIGLFDQYGVALVDMSHTHYNELSNDGRTIFAATRSTGQIDEGPSATRSRGLIAGSSAGGSKRSTTPSHS